MTKEHIDDDEIREKLIECLGDFHHGYSDDELQEMTTDELKELLDEFTDDSYNSEEE